jgi:glycogen operon protein
MQASVRLGSPYPLGATWDGLGVNFALFSAHASSVELCLFDSPHATRESRRIVLPERSSGVWHGYVSGVGPGLLYGYRVHGSYEPHHGLRFNPNKLLLDPYARCIGRPLRWDPSLFAYRLGDAQEDLARDDRDSAAAAPLAAVAGDGFAWGDDAPPRTPWHESVLYELNVKGFTQLHPEVPAALRGTYAGLASEPALRHLRELGVTAVELLPVHLHAIDRQLVERGLTNYWGYNTLAYFAPDHRYAAAANPLEVVREFRTMVRALHAAGIEVILDVVYNHTAEGNRLGPTLSLRGIDNRAYYLLDESDERRYVDFTGCGNTLRMHHPRVLQLIVDSLRYWVTEMHVDGFRFDLATTLGRDPYEFNRASAFFHILHQDPVLSQVKLIAEPWDLGPGGYQVGCFPAGWAEWNGRYRDCVRRFWRGDGGQLSELATRLAGSSDLYDHDGRAPQASINFVTAHDGFTLRDLVSYERKVNRDNGEENRDGDDNNHSWNCGAEGHSDDPAVNQLRRRQQRNLLTTLLLSQGVPMLCGGDEMGRTQNGNNNAYCQDNETSWFDWSLDDERRDLLHLCRFLIDLRRRHPVFRRRRFPRSRRPRGAELQELAWFQASGEEMTDAAWGAEATRAFMARLGGRAEELNADAEQIDDEDFVLLVNGSTASVVFQLPAHRPGIWWERILDTSEAAWAKSLLTRSDRYRLRDRAVALFRISR